MLDSDVLLCQIGCKTSRMGSKKSNNPGYDATMFNWRTHIEASVDRPYLCDRKSKNFPRN